MKEKDEDLEFFQDWWKLFRAFQNPPYYYGENKKEIDKFWNDFVDSGRALNKKYQDSENDEYYMKMIIDLINEIARRSKIKKV